MRRTLLAACAAALLLLVPSAALAAVPGVNVSRLTAAGDPYAGSAADAPQVWRDIADSGARTLRAFAPWRMDSYQLSVYDQFVTKARARGLAVDLVVTGSAADMSTPSAYAQGIGALAARLKGRGVTYEIWNEPDDTPFWKGAPQPAAYTALLEAAHKAVKAADPDAKVLVGGLVGNDFDFLERLYANGAKGSFDGVAVHTDTACNTTDPTQYYRDPTGRIGRYSFTGYREVHRTMVEHGDAKPIWMTELGWSTTGGTCDMGLSAGAKPGGVSEAQQATFLTHAYECLANDPYVQQGLWFSLSDFSSASSASANRFGLETDALARKPAFAAFTHAGSLGAIPCGGAMDSSGPTVSITSPRDGIQYYTGVLHVHIAASDAQGVQDINLFVDGRRIGIATVKHGTTATADLAYGGAAKLAFGAHTLLAQARDPSHNVGSSRITIVRVGGGYGGRIASRLKVRYGKVRHRRLPVAASVRFADGVRGAGTIELRFERRIHGRWVRKGVSRHSAYRPLRFTYAFRGAGQWRVRTRFIPRGPFRPAAVAPRILRVR